MGKNKKKFIAKGEGEKFYLLHRSKTDEAHASEGVPSTFVLVKAGENGNEVRRHNRDLFSSRSDHVTSQGFLNDGYDYSQHLQELGGGHFIGRDGKARDSSSIATASKIELPVDLLPSEGQLDRHFDSITISPECMDPDIAEALFGNAEDNANEDWVLDDDFVAQAAAEPETPDFDFDAHIAALIERSERSMGIATARGWDKPPAIEEGNDSDYCSSYESDNDVADNNDDFDKLVAEYGDDALGDLEDEVGELDLEGAIDLEDENADPLLQAAMQEMIEERRDFALCHGVKPQKGVRDLDDISGAATELSEEQLKQQVAEFISEATAPVSTEEDDAAEALEAIKSVAYLAEEREVSQWDCESVLSTYSTLDNHPSLIRIDKHKSKHTQAASKATAAKNAASPAPIILAGKHMLPQGYGITKKQTQLAPIPDDSSSSDEEDDKNRRKGETPQQRKERKQRVKAERREKRAHKKQLKNAFQSETVRLHTITGGKQDTDHMSVYKYSTA